MLTNRQDNRILLCNTLIMIQLGYRINSIISNNVNDIKDKNSFDCFLNRKQIMDRIRISRKAQVNCCL